MSDVPTSTKLPESAVGKVENPFWRVRPTQLIEMGIGDIRSFSQAPGKWAIKEIYGPVEVDEVASESQHRLYDITALSKGDALITFVETATGRISDQPILIR